MVENTITGLRINQFGAEGVKAQGTLTMDTKPIANDTVTIGDMTYTFKASPSVTGDVAIGAAVANSQVNLAAVVNAGDSFNAINPAASMSAFSVNVSTLTARRPGTAGNSIVTTEAFTAVTNIFNAATLGTTTAGSFARGTAVAATSKIAVEKLDWDDADEGIFRPSFAVGLLMRNRGDATAVEHGTRWSFSDQPFVWEQFMHWLSMAINGSPTVVYTGGVYRWTFTRDPAANPNLLSYTFERRFSDGNANYVDQRASYMLPEEISVKWAKNEDLKMSAKGFGRKFNTNTLTAALSLPTSELGVSALSTAWLDTTWGGLGGTQLTEQVIGWEWMLKTGAFPRHTAEGRTDLDFTKHQFDAANVQTSLKMTLLMDPTRYATESTAAAAGTRRAIQVKASGSGSRLIKINGLYQYAKPALFKIGEESGQDVVDVELEEATDQTNFLSVILDHPSVYSLA